ncbi:hypothetical protein [Salinarchaeum laminariae]|uniref:hypothetical protein n=1 Tax=Salinarchaeum laminariae TaxID=869888 RepID=UPI0020BE2D07|nr:hypothetical protein [Salinarchaeum laminariae]
MADWSERVDELLFDGESVESTVDVGAGTIVVTSHRVLVFTPEGDGPRYRAIDRPNVLGVEQRGVSPFDLFSKATKLGVGGGLLVLVGLVVDPEALFPRPDLSGAQGMGVVDTVDSMLGVFYALDLALLALGAVLSIVGVGLLTVQLATRKDRLAIEIAGEDDVVLSWGVDDATVAEIDAAIDVPEAEAQAPPAV